MTRYSFYIGNVVFGTLSLASAVNPREPDMFWPPLGTAIPLYDDLGDLSFAVDANVPAQRYADQGYSFLSAFDFSRAVVSFRAAQQLDPQCVMCVWGEALALGPSLNSFDESKLVASEPLAYERAREAFRRSMEDETARLDAQSRALILALASRYNATVRGYLQNEHMLTERYAEAMAEIYMQFGPDANLAALAAVALMNTHPWDYWQESGIPRPEAARALVIIEEALLLDPRHAFIVHLFVHITEASGNVQLLRRAQSFAEVLPDLQPGAPHIQHMAFHTLMHTGGYADSDADNERASTMPRQIYPMHNLDTLAWVCRIQGRQQCALSAASRLTDLALQAQEEGLFETGFPPARFAAQQLLTMVAFSMSGAILAAEPPLSCTESFSCGIWHYARGVSWARRGNPERARLAAADLQDKRRVVAASAARPPEWAWKNFNGSREWGMFPADAILGLAEHELAAFIAYAEGNLVNEVASWRAAADAETALPYDEPPSWYLPVGTRFSNALRRAGSLQKAGHILNMTLAVYPHNGWALFEQLQLCQIGGGRCEELQHRFDLAWRHADSTTPNIGEVLAVPDNLANESWHRFPRWFLMVGAFSLLAVSLVVWGSSRRRRQCARCAPESYWNLSDEDTVG